MDVVQRLGRQWDHLHPFCAAEVVRLNEPMSHTRAACAMEHALLDLGLGAIETRGHRFHHVAAIVPVRKLSADSDLDAFIDQQMNATLSEADGAPFRPFFQDSAHGPALGIVYPQWICDSVRPLLREWIYRILSIHPQRKTPFPHWPEPSRGSRFVQLPRAIAALWASRKGRRVRRLPAESFDDLTVAHTLLHLPDGTAEALRAAARRANGSVDDLLLCSIARICDSHLPSLDSHRPDLAVGFAASDTAAPPALDCDTLRSPPIFSRIICSAGMLPDRELMLRHIAAANSSRSSTSRSRASPAPSPAHPSTTAVPSGPHRKCSTEASESGSRGRNTARPVSGRSPCRSRSSGWSWPR